MKLIDEKGRIFGRINILDIFIAVVALVSLAAIYMVIVHRDKLKSTLVGEDEMWYMQIEIITSQDDVWLKKYVLPGYTEKERYGRPAWQIVDIKEIIDENLKNRLLVKVRIAVYKERRGTVYYGRYNMVVGGEIRLEGSAFSLKGVIYSIGGLTERIPA
jgi:hypothetical protein